MLVVWRQTANGSQAGDLSIQCFVKSGHEVPGTDGVDYQGGKGPICNMTGSAWEALPYPVIIDSGAFALVIQEKWRSSHVETRETEASGEECTRPRRLEEQYSTEGRR